jgi:hypothetical protein
MKRFMSKRVLALTVLIVLALVTLGCTATVGVGVSYGYPGRWGGGWGGPVYVGGPVW